MYYCMYTLKKKKIKLNPVNLAKYTVMKQKLKTYLACTLKEHVKVSAQAKNALLSKP